MQPLGGLLALLLCCFLCLQALALPFSYMHNNEFNFLQPIKSIKINKESKEKDNTLGKLKLCPPGGRSFFEALQIACPMRKRRKRSVTFEEMWQAIDSDTNHSPDDYRPASPEEIMGICCYSGCELVDFFPYCGPF
ncbi:hypothetical protein M3Y97_00810800 [Aphelenchoides bicaudatus]|nr:hypothetical protein M3Y97_00810800 [Aphelenchoides bicaudatus]